MSGIEHFISGLKKCHNHYEIEVVDAGDTVLPNDLYSDELVYLSRDVKAIRLFKSKRLATIGAENEEISHEENDTKGEFDSILGI